MTTEENASPTTYLPSMRRTLLMALGSIARVAGSVLLLIEHASLSHGALKGEVVGGSRPTALMAGDPNAEELELATPAR
ncbi:hypothetical protein ACFWIY_23240 [Streptomyces sioyaensis]|uniref:hypothetical protein n=1 Tax=Streptomyces sioyaensis TaxID=67364 RepID=UPI00364CF2A6